MEMRPDIIDIHAHILPGIDDGAKDWEESGEMLDIAAAHGITAIIATPHYNRHTETNQVRALARRLEQEAQKGHPGFLVYPGHEILYFESILEALREGKALTLADSRYVLTEFMPATPYQKMYQGLRKILQGGYYPVVAHVERYDALRKEDNLQELREMGCLLQMNYDSLQGTAFDKNVRWCRSQIRQERIHILGTDMHHSTRRAPAIGKSLDWLDRHAEQEYLSALIYGQGMEILKKDEKNVRFR